jgi:hypothetical protein
VLDSAIRNAIDRATLQAAVEGVFSRFGKVERIQLLPDNQHHDQRVGCMVDMETAAQAMDAQGQLGVTVFGFKTLIFSLALPDGFRDRITL